MLENWISPVEFEHEWGNMNDYGYSHCKKCGILDVLNGSVWGWIGEKDGEHKNLLCGLCAFQCGNNLSIHCLSQFGPVRPERCFNCRLELNSYDDKKFFPLRAPCDNWAFYWNLSEIHSITMDWHGILNILVSVSTSRDIQEIIHGYLSLPLLYCRTIFLHRQEEKIYREQCQHLQQPWIFSFFIILHLQNKEGNFYYRYNHVARYTLVKLCGLSKNLPRYLF